MRAMEEGNAYSQTLRALKQALDPNGILAPGRYSSAQNIPSAPEARPEATASEY